MTTLERGLEALERGATPDDGFNVIAIEIVSPSKHEPENRFCIIESVTHTCGADDLVAGFNYRMRAVAKNLNLRQGWSIQIICSPENLGL